MKNFLLIILAFLFGASMTIAGAYISIKNFFIPQGNLLEGILLLSNGIMFFLILFIANNIGNLVLNFKNIYSSQVEIHQKTFEFLRDLEPKKPHRTISDIFADKSKGLSQSSMIITDLNTGETTTTPIGNIDSLEKLNSFIFNSINKSVNNKMPGETNKKTLENMNLEELEKELSIAIKEENFERASAIE